MVSAAGNGKWIAGIGCFVETWTNGEYTLPSLTGECSILSPLKGQFMSLSQADWFSITSKDDRWFINENYYEYVEGNYPVLQFRSTGLRGGKKDKIYSINIEDLASEGDYKSTGGYIEFAVNKSNSPQSLPIIRINQSPTVYIRKKLEKFARDLARVVLELHPEQEHLFRYSDKNALSKENCPFKRFDSIWMMRRNLKQSRYDERNFSELLLCGDLGHAIHRIVACALHEQRLMCTQPGVFNDFSWFFNNITDAWWFGGGSCHISEDEAANDVFSFEYHALEVKDDESIEFYSNELIELAKNAWEYALLREEADLDGERIVSQVMMNKHGGGYSGNIPPRRRLLMEDMLRKRQEEMGKIWNNIKEQQL